MNATHRRAIGAVVAMVLLGLSGCAGLSARDRNTITGAAIGGVAGSVMTNGSSIGTVGGAAVGGVIGNEVGRNRPRR
jgi:osmotically inducible lipoprotein OsmB